MDTHTPDALAQRYTDAELQAHIGVFLARPETNLRAVAAPQESIGVIAFAVWLGDTPPKLARLEASMLWLGNGHLIAGRTLLERRLTQAAQALLAAGKDSPRLS